MGDQKRHRSRGLFSNPWRRQAIYRGVLICLFCAGGIVAALVILKMVVSNETFSADAMGGGSFNIP